MAGLPHLQLEACGYLGGWNATRSPQALCVIGQKGAHATGEDQPMAWRWWASVGRRAPAGGALPTAHGPADDAARRGRPAPPADPCRPTRAERLAWALYYAERLGWPVLPLYTPLGLGTPSRPAPCACRQAACSSAGKHPRTQHGVRGASRDPAVVRRWWSAWPDANLGVATGQGSGLVVLDVDGAAGEASLGALVDAGALPLDVVDTPLVLTGRGLHLYLAHPGVPVGNRAMLRPNLDVRGDGGYVVAPPSLHANGAPYLWVPGRLPGDLPLARLAA